MKVFIVFWTPLLIASLLLCLILALYLVLKGFVKLVRWSVRKLVSLIRWTFRTPKRAVIKGLALGRWVIKQGVRVITRTIAMGSQGVTYATHRFRHRGVPTYQIPSTYNTAQGKNLEPVHYTAASPYPTLIGSSTSSIPPRTPTENPLFSISQNNNSQKVERVRFCQICGAPLDLNLSSPDFPAICRECGSELSLGIDPICRKHVLRGEDAVRCPQCLTVFHRHHVADWASLHGRCPFCNSPFERIEMVENPLP